MADNDTQIELEYPFEKKKLLATKISQMTNKIDLKKIKKIITDNNPNIKSSKNSYGSLMYFHNYTTDTYYLIENIINEIDKETNERINSSLSCFSDIVISSDILSDDEPEIIKMRYTNKEKRLIKRQKYEDVITKSNNDCNKNSN